MAKALKKKIDVYQAVTDRIIESLESGSIPWLKPWKDGNNADPSMPYNASTGRAYNGINVLLLWSMPYESNGWLTYNQAASCGGNVKKGEKSTLVTFWQFLKEKKKGRETGRTIPMIKHFNVFNVEQCENLENLKTIEPIVIDNTDALTLAKNNGATVKHGGNKAFFKPSADYIQMPPQANFNESNDYDCTLLHELTHWTGHKARLERDFTGRFGDDAYAFEELVAEMGSAFLCCSLGVQENILQHTAYLQSWLKVLKADKRAIFTAASKAKAACESLLTYSFINQELAA